MRLNSKPGAACLLVVLCCAIAGPVAAETEAECGALTNPVGPFDYRNPHPEIQRDVGLVNRDHLQAAVQRLSRKEDMRLVIADLDFMLRVFPNHHVALQYMVRYYLIENNTYGYRTAGCYFERARRFVPDDTQVLLIEAYYRLKKGQRQLAMDAYNAALEIDPDSLDAHYNLGLMYVDAGDYKRAMEHARIAYAGGFPLPGLRRRLEKAGAWSDPEPKSEEPAAPQ